MIQFLDGRVTLYPGDCLEVLASLPENSIDSAVMDPPYHLTSIVERFGKEGAAEAKAGETGAFKRASAGFMGKQWDGGDIAFQVATWEAVKRVLKPGGYILAFASTRGFWRMSVAIEDAGFITHPLIAWVFGSGFPKATRLKAEGYDGWRYGGQALKPAIEPIYMGQKPFSEKTGTANVLLHGTGAVNIEGCRIGTDDTRNQKKGGKNDFAHEDDSWTPKPVLVGSACGRWPANLIHDGSAEVIEVFPETDSSSQRIGARSGKKTGVLGEFVGQENVVMGHDDEGGSAARFFYAAEKDVRCDLCRVLLTAKNGIESPCDVNTAESISPTQSTKNGNTAHGGAVVSLQRESAGKNPRSKGRASTAASSSFRCLPISGHSAQNDVLMQEALKIAPSVRSAATLCDSCETDIARSLAAMRLGLNPASLPCPGSMPERKRQILLRHLALYVAGRENTDTITTTASLRTLFGSVFHAIASTTSLERAEEAGNTESAQRIFYSSKADADDRIGSKHPTVKPVDLMRYLVRLVTPPGGTVLDCFAGTGTTGEAAWREGFNAVLIEREPEYQQDIAERMRLCLAGPDEKRREIIKRRGLADDDAGPLFGGAA